MVDSIGSRLVNMDRGVTRLAAVTPTPAPRGNVQTSVAPTPQAAEMVQSLAASPPVDLKRVERIKQAIAEGAYPILPGTIADNMLALRLQLRGEGKN